MIDPESCYIGYELGLPAKPIRPPSTAPSISSAEDSVVRLIPPYGPIADYRALFADMPEDSLLLGRMLVRCGSFTEDELAQALKPRERLELNSQPAGKPALARRGPGGPATGG